MTVHHADSAPLNFLMGCAAAAGFPAAVTLLTKPKLPLLCNLVLADMGAQQPAGIGRLSLRGLYGCYFYFDRCFAVCSGHACPFGGVAICGVIQHLTNHGAKCRQIFRRDA